VRRLLSISAVTLMMLAAFALAWQPTSVCAASNPGNLTLVSAPAPAGCALGAASTFCDQAPGTTSAAAQFTVQANANLNSVAVNVAAIPGLTANFAAGDFTVSSNTCTGSLQANQQCQMSVEFSPTTSGLRQAQITVADSAGDSLIINVEGKGTQLALAAPPPATCTPAVPADNAYMYCAQPINPTAPTTETFTLSSASGATGVNAALAAIPGLESEFAVNDFTVTSPQCPSTIASGGTCAIGIAFTPTAAGLRSAALTATDSSGDVTTIYLAGPTSSGLGISSATGSNSQLCGTTNHFIFCNLPTGGISSSTIFAVQNTSGTQITGLAVPTGSVIAQGATSPDFTVQNTSCTSVLNSGASCNVTVSFTPTASGLRQGAIVITDAQGDSTALNLAGVGDDYSIAPQLPTEVSVVPGGTAKFTATLTPDNVFGMNGEQVTFVCPTNLPTNTSCAVTPCPAMITPATPVTVTVTIVTSSATTVAPQPTAGCSTYGPSQTAFITPPPAARTGPRAADSIGSRGSPVGTALLILGALGAFGLLAAGFAAPQIAGSRKRVPLMLACAALTAAILSGCHHHGATVTTATPTGVTDLKVFGSATDANGNSLNASRSFTVTLDVVTK
jgi:hypothetical protein